MKNAYNVNEWDYIHITFLMRILLIFKHNLASKQFHFFNNRVLRENQMFSTTKVSGGPAFSPPMQNKGWGGQGPAAQLKQEEAGLCGLKKILVES